MPSLVELRNKKALEVTDKDAYNGKVAPENAPLSTILYDFVGLIAADS